MAIAKKQEESKKVWKTLEVSADLTQGTSATLEGSTLKVTGPKGEVSRLFKYPHVYVKVEGSNIIVGTKKFTQRVKKIIFTYLAHVTNMVKGVSEGFEYKLVVVYAKFPITAELKGNVFTVKNLLGEKVPRTLSIPQDVKVEVKGGKEIIVTGIDKERVGQVAASLEQLTRITHLDRRVIQDGIYITEKPHKRYA